MLKALNDIPVQDNLILPVHQVPQTLLLTWLNQADVCTQQRVLTDEPAPGPFGASTYAYNIRTKQSVQIGNIDSNRVNRDGPAAHAEAVALYPDRAQQIDDFLIANKDDKDWVLIFESTGQSCPSCNSKQQIYVSDWIARDLIDESRVINAYGATYDMTLETAGFSDKIQLDDMQQFPNGGDQNSFSETRLSQYPSTVISTFADSNRPVAVVFENGQIVGVGVDERRRANLIATAEVNAVQVASRLKQDLGMNEPWDLNDAVLLSPTDMASAPLARATGFWAKISDYRTVKGFENKATQESPLLDNQRLYEAVVDTRYGSYGPSSLIHTFQVRHDGQDGRFENLAQKAWPVRVAREAEGGKNVHYDGGKDGVAAPTCGH